MKLLHSDGTGAATSAAAWDTAALIYGWSLRPFPSFVAMVRVFSSHDITGREGTVITSTKRQLAAGSYRSFTLLVLQASRLQSPC